MADRLKSPFPYAGGKGRWTEIILPRLGTGANAPVVYAEPFAGSLAVLLASAPHEREIVCDTSGHIVNFWRAVQQYPDAVARWADWPTFHHDLTARHRWLRRWGVQMSPMLRGDPTWCDPKAAGWWCWGISNWIGGSFAEVSESGMPSVHKIPNGPAAGGGRGVQVGVGDDGTPDAIPHPGGPSTGGGGGRGVSVLARDIERDSIPHIHNTPGGRGGQVRRKDDQIPKVVNSPGGSVVSVQSLDGMPAVAPVLGGRGVLAQAQQIEREVYDKRPHVNGSGQGVQPNRVEDRDWTIGTGERLLARMRRLQQRLARVVVLNRDWSAAVTPTLLMHTPSSPKPPVAVFLDPPYRTEGRAALYGSDLAGTSDAAAVESWRWAVEHGEQYRIAYACHEGDVELPPGWTSETMSFRHGGAGREDMVAFSPACIAPDGLVEEPRLL